MSTYVQDQLTLHACDNMSTYIQDQLTVHVCEGHVNLQEDQLTVHVCKDMSTCDKTNWQHIYMWGHVHEVQAQVAIQTSLIRLQFSHQQYSGMHGLRFLRLVHFRSYQQSQPSQQIHRVSSSPYTIPQTGHWQVLPSLPSLWSLPSFSLATSAFLVWCFFLDNLDLSSLFCCRSTFSSLSFFSCSFSLNFCKNSSSLMHVARVVSPGLPFLLSTDGWGLGRAKASLTTLLALLVVLLVDCGMEVTRSFTRSYTLNGIGRWCLCR